MVSSGNGGGAVVEFQAFRGVHNEYVIKEFAVVDLATDRFVLASFAPPFGRGRLQPKIRKPTIGWKNTIIGYGGTMVIYRTKI